MKRLLLAVALVALTVSCNGIVSGYFRLRDDSPLPSWAVLPAGMTRDQANVRITIYEATTSPQWKVRFEIRNKRRWFFKTIQKDYGYGYWHPDSLRRSPPGGTFPNWIVIEVKGTKEVYESSEANDLLKIVKK
jgi:hypothetical protein